MQTSTFIRTPSNLEISLRSDGCANQVGVFQRALAQAGLFDLIVTKDLAVLERIIYSGDHLRAEKTCNSPVARRFTLASAVAVARAQEQKYTPLVCSGDRSVLPECGLALARKGRYALVYLDAHRDYQRSDASNFARADPATVTGNGTELLTNTEGHRPYFREEDVWGFDFNCPDLDKRWGLEEPANTGVGLTTLEDGRTLGMEWVGRVLADSYEKQPALDGFWIHLNAGVLEPVYRRTVDRLEPGGLTPEELTTLLARLLRSPRFVGMDVTLLHPGLDSDGEGLRTIIDVLTKAFQGRICARS